MDSTDERSRRIERCVLDLIRDGAGTDFDSVALEVFAYQYERIPAYRRFCDSRDRTPAVVESVDQIPAIPTDVFKYGLLPDAESDAAAVFLSSGTTEGLQRRSRHVARSLETYRASAMMQFDRMVTPDAPGRMSVAILGPTRRTHPESSLGHMFSWCAESHGGDTAFAAMDAAGALRDEDLVAWLESSAAGNAPVLLLGISSAFTRLFASLRERGLVFRLPADSRLVDTGGAKGAAAVLSAKGLLKAAWKFLHIPSYLCVNEYGMTEMFSQFYDDALRSRFDGDLAGRSKVGPLWVRTTVVDPATLRPVNAGEPGLLRHFDLANWDSICSLQTLDIGRSSGHGFDLLGRAKGAETRGCSSLLSEFRTTSERRA